MSWIRMDDGFDENPKQLALSDAAFRVWVCSWAFCARQPSKTMTALQADTLLRKLNKPPKLIRELLLRKAWEEIDGGYEVHDLSDYLSKSSAERVRQHRARKRDETDGNADVTVTPRNTLPPDVTGRNAPRARGGAPGPVPVPVPVPVPLPPVGEEASDFVPSSLTDSPQGGGVTAQLVNTALIGAPVLTTIQGAQDQAYERFLAELNAATGRQFRGTAESRRLFRRCIQQGRTVDDLLAAARGVALSKHHMGLNDSSIPYNAPTNVLRSKVLDQLISLGRGEIGVMREETALERQQRETHEWAERKRREREGA